MTRVLVIDDERKMRRVLQIVLEGMGIESTPAESAEEALELFGRQQFDLVLSDLKLPGMDALDLLRRLRDLDAEVPVIVLTAYGTVQTAVEAMKLGAFDFVLKPFAVENLEMLIRRALGLRQMQRENVALREQAAAAPAFESLVGASASMQKVYELIRQIAPTRSSVLVTGETGTGKELVARAIHNLSPRAGRVFVALNCAAIPGELLESELFGHARGAFTGAQAERTGKFELANEGTLFLDEIGDLAYELQAKLLRVLQEGILERVGSNRSVPVDVRVISSTNRDLGVAMREGRFREDLFYRLNVFEIHLPPLCERREDVAEIARHFLERFAGELGKKPLHLSDEACRVLADYRWPGNVRELRNLMERAAVLAVGHEVDAQVFHGMLPAAAEASEGGAAGAAVIALDAGGFELEPAVEELERKIILRALGASGDNKAQAARLLGISERTLWYKLKRYGL